MKYFMPQNFRGDQGSNRGGKFMNQRGRGGNNFARGGRGGQNQGPQRYGGRGGQRGSQGRDDHMGDMGATPTPMPNQGGTPTPQPNLMFSSQDLQAFAHQMQGMPMQQLQGFQ